MAKRDLDSVVDLSGKHGASNSHSSAGEIAARRARKGRMVLVVAPVVALVLTAVTLLCVWFAVPHDIWCHELFFKRSWIQYANTFFFWLAVSLLVFRWWRHRREFAACEVIADELDKGDYADMNWQNVFVLTDSLASPRFHKWRFSLVFSRVTRALVRLEKTQSTGEMREYMRMRGDIDSEELESSYAGIRYLAWLIPTLGFVGTVLGIGAGISSCGDIVQQSATLGGEMPDISFALAALGTAFDTTFLALVYSAIAVFFMSFQLKEEEQLLESIDHLCIDEVCGKFQEHSTINDGLIERLLNMEEKLIDNVHGDRAELCRVISRELPTQLAGAISDLFETLRNAQKNQLEGLLGQLKDGTQEAGDRMTEQLKEVVGSLSDSAREEIDELRGSVKRLEESMQQVVTALNKMAGIGAKAQKPAAKQKAESKPAPTEPPLPRSESRKAEDSPEDSQDAASGTSGDGGGDTEDNLETRSLDS